MREHELMQQAVSEIRQLRHHNEIMAARLTMFDHCMLILTAHVQLSSSGEMSPNICREIEVHIQHNKPPEPAR